jgi:hypothetical protein
MSNHTPGNWYAMTGETGGIVDQANVFSDHETDGEPTFIADTLGIDDEVPLEQRRANAYLIAASKKLLAAAKAVCPILQMNGDGPDDQKRFDALCEAIAEAEGPALSQQQGGK